MFDFLNSPFVSGLMTTALAAIIGGLIKIHRKITDLHDWHNKEDEEGVKIWYSRSKNMETAMDKMADILVRMDHRDELFQVLNQHQTEVLEKHTQVIESLVAVCSTLVIETKSLKDNIRK